MESQKYTQIIALHLTDQNQHRTYYFVTADNCKIGGDICSFAELRNC